MYSLQKEYVCFLWARGDETETTTTRRSGRSSQNGPQGASGGAETLPRSSGESMSQGRRGLRSSEVGEEVRNPRRAGASASVEEMPLSVHFEAPRASRARGRLRAG
jgi:hypothetical protein